MNSELRKAQKNILGIFAKEAKQFALAGGTALELYYLHHRFSSDLDFFSPTYDLAEIELLISAFKKLTRNKIQLESELNVGGKARVRFYSMSVKGTSRPLKIDFVEDVILKQPKIKKIKGVRVYSAEDIYLQKIVAIAGIQPVRDDTGRLISEGRNEARDVFDVYLLSKNIEPLSSFLKRLSGHLQKGIVHWHRRFSRQELILALLEMDIYNSEFDAKEMIRYLEAEIKAFTRGLIEG